MLTVDILEEDSSADEPGPVKQAKALYRTCLDTGKILLRKGSLMAWIHKKDYVGCLTSNSLLQLSWSGWGWIR